MGWADLHIHTKYSWDGTSSVESVLQRAVEVGLHVVAITDHDEVRGAHEAVKMAGEFGIDVIPGCEVSSADGHVLALFIDRVVPEGLSLGETLLRVGDQGGLCIAAHPAAHWVNSLKPDVIRRAFEDSRLGSIFVGLEVYNAGIFHKRGNITTQQIAASLPVAHVGNSDAHLLWMIGKGRTYFQGSTVAELRRSLVTGMTKAVVDGPTAQRQIILEWLAHHIPGRASAGD